MEIFALIKNIFSWLWSIIMFFVEFKENKQKIKNAFTKIGEWRRSAGAAIKRFWNKYINFVQWYKKVKYYENMVKVYNGSTQRQIRIYCQGMLLEYMTRMNIDFTEDEIKNIWFDKNGKLLKEIEYNGFHLIAPHVCVFMMNQICEFPRWMSKREKNFEIAEMFVRSCPQLLENPDAIDDFGLYDIMYNASMRRKLIVHKETWFKKFKRKCKNRKMKKRIRSYSKYLKKYDPEKFKEILNNADTIVKLN